MYDWCGEEWANDHRLPCLVLKSSFRGKIVEEKGWGAGQERTPAAEKLMLQLDDCRRCTGVAQGAATTLTMWDNTPKINVQLFESCCLQENLVISFMFSKRRPLRLNENLLSMVRMHLFLHLNGAAAPFSPFQSCYLTLRIMPPPHLAPIYWQKNPTFPLCGCSFFSFLVPCQHGKTTYQPGKWSFFSLITRLHSSFLDHFFFFFLNTTSLPVHIHAAPSFLSLAKT